jgi:hypothetical protein
MHSSSKVTNQRSLLTCCSSSLSSIGQSLLVSISIVMCLSLSAKAADRVVLKFESSQVTVPITNIRTFVATGEPQTPEFIDFAKKNPRVGEILQKVLGKEITFSGKFREKLATSSVGEFVLTQVDKLISSGGTGVEALRTSFQASLKSNNQVSILELLENYPTSTVYLDVAVLERVYDDVKVFAERIQPALEAIKSTLQEVICDCGKPATPPKTSSQSSPSTEFLSAASPSTKSVCSKD